MAGRGARVVQRRPGRDRPGPDAPNPAAAVRRGCSARSVTVRRSGRSTRRATSSTPASCSSGSAGSTRRSAGAGRRGGHGPRVAGDRVRARRRVRARSAGVPRRARAWTRRRAPRSRALDRRRRAVRASPRGASDAQPRRVLERLALLPASARRSRSRCRRRSGASCSRITPCSLSRERATAGAGPWAAPLLLAYDAVETAALVRGGIRYRTLVSVGRPPSEQRPGAGQHQRGLEDPLAGAERNDRAGVGQRTACVRVTPFPDPPAGERDQIARPGAAGGRLVDEPRVERRAARARPVRAPPRRRSRRPDGAGSERMPPARTRTARPARASAATAPSPRTASARRSRPRRGPPGGGRSRSRSGSGCARTAPAPRSLRASPTAPGSGRRSGR